MTEITPEIHDALTRAHENSTKTICKGKSSSNALLYGGAYNFKHQPERLKYIGKHSDWNQFEKVGEVGVWCELLDSDLHMIEETDDFNYEHDYDVGN